MMMLVDGASSKSYVLEDTVWGTHELDPVEDKILIALLESPTVQRLKTVLQVS